MTEETPPSSAEHLWIDWNTYHQAIEELALLIHESDWKFDQILCLARGGLRPGDILSRIFDVPLAILATSSYIERGGTVQGELSVASAITLARGELAGRVLLVDDLVDSGITLQKVQQHLVRSHTAVTEVRSAVLWHKHCSVMRPDYCLHSLPGNPWIHQPFEQYDGLRPEQLPAWAKRGKY
ncbi:MAG: phosphoribosyltransferase [Pseudomonadota bacterium]